MTATLAPQPGSTRVAHLAEKVILGLIAGIAVVIGVLEIVFASLRVGDLLANPDVTLRDTFLDEPLDLLSASDAVVSTTVTQVDVVVTGLAVGDRVYLIAATLLSSLLTLGICAVVIWLCVRVFLGRPFVRSVTWGIGVVAILVIVAGLGVPTLTATGYAEAALVLGIDELAPFVVEVDPAPLGWGMALAVVAGAFEIGQRMQRDAEGLV